MQTSPVPLLTTSASAGTVSSAATAPSDISTALPEPTSQTPSAEAPMAEKYASPSPSAPRSSSESTSPSVESCTSRLCAPSPLRRLSVSQRQPSPAQASSTAASSGA